MAELTDKTEDSRKSLTMALSLSAHVIKLKLVIVELDYAKGCSI